MCIRRNIFKLFNFKKTALKKGNNVLTFDVIDIDEFENRPIANREFLIVNDYKNKLRYYYLDHKFERIFLGMKMDDCILQKISELLSDPKDINHDSKVVEGKVELISGHRYLFTTYNDVSFILPIINDSNYHDDIVVELAYNGGNVDIGTKWKATSTPINGMGVYFITYRYSRTLKNWVASIELISD